MKGIKQFRLSQLQPCSSCGVSKASECVLTCCSAPQRGNQSALCSHTTQQTQTPSVITHVLHLEQEPSEAPALIHISVSLSYFIKTSKGKRVLQTAYVSLSTFKVTVLQNDCLEVRSTNEGVISDSADDVDQVMLLCTNSSASPLVLSTWSG